MVHFKSVSFALFSLLISSSLADDTLSTDLVGCDEVSCPKAGSADRCTVGDEGTFIGIGLSRIADVPSALEGISLVKGVNVSKAVNKRDDTDTRPYKSVYYVATPESLEQRDLSGCAVFFHDPPAEKFKGPELEGNTTATDSRAAHGTCPDVIAQRCVDSLTERARKVAADASGDACAAIERELKKDSIDGCGDLSGEGRGLGNFTVSSLGNLSTVSNSSSSDCWPVKPKSDTLAKITENTVMRNFSATALYDEGYKITPVLTVFQGGNNSIVNSASAQLTCLKIVTTEDPKEDEDEEASENAASGMGVNGGLLTAGMAMLVAAFAAGM